MKNKEEVEKIHSSNDARDLADAHGWVRDYLYNYGLNELDERIKQEDVVVASALKENIGDFKKIIKYSW